MSRRAEPGAKKARTTAAETEIAVRMLDPKWRDLWPAAGRCARSAARSAIEAAISSSPGCGAELTIVLADDGTVHRLNRQYRGIDKPTNVLSFGNTDGERRLAPGSPAILGDVVLARETVAAEAADQGKSVGDHAVHLVVHGVLHLLGHDHRHVREADLMESIEVQVLARLGVSNPYVAKLSRRGARRRA
ncbi:MAG: rRNA maturation RNase YbeY [Dongiaceae bacterium]